MLVWGETMPAEDKENSHVLHRRMDG